MYLRFAGCLSGHKGSEHTRYCIKITHGVAAVPLQLAPKRHFQNSGVTPSTLQSPGTQSPLATLRALSRDIPQPLNPSTPEPLNPSTPPKPPSVSGGGRRRAARAGAGVADVGHPHQGTLSTQQFRVQDKVRLSFIKLYEAIVSYIKLRLQSQYFRRPGNAAIMPSTGHPWQPYNPTESVCRQKKL